MYVGAYLIKKNFNNPLQLLLFDFEIRFLTSPGRIQMFLLTKKIAKREPKHMLVFNLSRTDTLQFLFL